MGSPLSPVIANLYMEDLESEAIKTARHPPRFYKRYVDDSFLIMTARFVDSFFEHMNSQDESIKFTIEREEENQLAFLDTLAIRTHTGEIQTKVFRKSTHTDQYLDYRSHHPLEHKRSVVNTLLYRADNVVSEENDRKDEKQHITDALKRCHYPPWVIKNPKPKTRQDPHENNTQDRSRYTRTTVIPYIKGLSEKIRSELKKHKISTMFKPHNTLRNMLVKPKDKTDKMNQAGIIYHIKCDDCESDYIGESERMAKERLPEHRRKSSVTKSSMAEHIVSHKHRLDISKYKQLDTELDYFKRGIKEAIYIRKHKPSLNRDSGRHNLPHAWDRLIDQLPRPLGGAAIGPESAHAQ